MSSPKREFLFKVLVVGDLGVGKTSIIQRYVHNIYSHCYRATIGVDFALKILNWEKDTVVRLQLWDIAGQERFGHMTRLYYREAAGAFVVCDLGRAVTLQSVQRWKDDLDSKVMLKNGKPIPMILIGNKSDLLPHGARIQNVEDLGHELEFTDCHMTSAKEPSLFILSVDKNLTWSRDGHTCPMFVTDRRLSSDNCTVALGNWEPVRPSQDQDRFLSVDNVNIDEAMSCLIKEMIANKEGSEPTMDPNIVKPSHLNFHYTKGCSQCCRF